MTDYANGSTPRILLRAYLTSDHISDATGKTVAVTISKNGGAFGNPSAGATNATEIANGWYYVDLSATDTGTNGPLIIRGTAASTDTVECCHDVVPAAGGRLTNLDAAVSSRMATYTQPTGFLSATFPSGTVANTTNITAGTITTVTNLTNAPTSGDLTATMKTSVTTAATSATPNLNSAYDFAKGTSTMTESYAASGAALTPVQALYQINQSLAENSVTATTMTVKKRDATTSAKTFTLNNATSPTSITETT